jgi:hypothetical protein
VFLPLSAPLYVYRTRQEAASACSTGGYTRLFSKAELAGHAKCDAGWTSDWEGYWMEKASAGCGSTVYNDWSGDAGAYCCGVAHAVVATDP